MKHIQPKDTWDKYQGIWMSQCKGAIKVIGDFIKENPFDMIIETGTYTGGMTLFLSKILGDKLHSFDIDGSFVKDTTRNQILGNNTSLYTEDIFNSNTIPKLLLSCKGRVLLLLDNGDKLMELAMYHRYLKEGDIVMLHDYHPVIPDKNTGSRIRWNGCEVSDDLFEGLNIKSLQKHNRYYTAFKDVFWLSLEKIDDI